MYFSMACRDEPPRSFIAAIAAVIMSMYGGWAAGRRAAAFFAGFLLFAIFRAGLLDLDLERDLERDFDLDLDRDLLAFTTPDMVNTKWKTK